VEYLDGVNRAEVIIESSNSDMSPNVRLSPVVLK